MRLLWSGTGNPRAEPQPVKCRLRPLLLQIGNDASPSHRSMPREQRPLGSGQVRPAQFLVALGDAAAGRVAAMFAGPSNPYARRPTIAW
jgi:hypothetical protein